MQLNRKILLITLIASALFYLTDVLIDVLLQHPGSSFFKLAIISPPENEMYTRAVGVIALLAAGLFTNEILRKQIVSGSITLKRETHKFSQDPNLLPSLIQQIRTPINAIIGFSELLKKPETSSSSKSLYVNHIHTSGNYLVELLNNIVDITRIETGQMINNKEQCKLNSIMKDLFGKYQIKMFEKNKDEIELNLKKGISDPDFTLQIDKQKLEQVICNLLDNSLAFTDSGKIEFGYVQQDDLFLEFFIRDTGAGFSVDRLEQMMDRYSRVMDEKMRPFDTAALRINISRHLVNTIGGKLTAESEFGKGSTFRFTVPLNVVEVYREEDIETDIDAKSINWSGKKVLIAEDILSNFSLLEAILDPTGVQVYWVQNGKEAVEYCKKNKDIDVILMDILMPEMDGYEAAKLVKKKRPQLPIIAQTAFSLDEEEYKDSKNYFDKYMIKPIWSHDLLNTLTEYLS